MEGLASASAVAGIISLGIEVCQGLLRYYNSYKGAATDVAHMYESIDSLESTLLALKRTLDRGSLSSSVAANVTKSIKSCEAGFRKLEEKLKKVKLSSNSQVGWQERAKGQLKRALYPFRESTLAKLREIVNEQRDHLKLALGVLQIDVSVDLRREVDAVQAGVGAVVKRVDSINDKSDKIAASIEDVQMSTAKNHAGIATLVSVHSNEYILSIYKWLSPLAGQFEKKQQDTYHMTARQDGKAKWVTNTPAFRGWLDGNVSTLWCPGIQGSGKTVLSSIVIHHLQELRKLRPDVGLAYIYFNYKQSDGYNVANLLSSLIHQLCSQRARVPSELTDLYERHSQMGMRPSVHELSSPLRTLTNGFSKTLVVIDALDECPEREAIREGFISELLAFQPQLQLLVTSRDIPMISSQLEGAEKIEIQASDEDIRIYLQERMDNSSRMKKYFAKDPSLKDRIVETVTSKAGGMFLQARLHLDSLMEKNNLKQLKATLEALPEDLDKTYDEVVERINGQSRDDSHLAWQVLGWVLHSARPISVVEVQHALAVEPEDTEIDEDSLIETELLTSVCAGIVTVQSEGEILGLVHLSTQKYLLRNSKRLFPETEKDMVQRCISYLSLEEFGSGPCDLGQAMHRRRQDYPLYSYAAQYWGVHAVLQDDEDLLESIITFLDDRPKLSSSIQIVSLQAQELSEIPPASPRSVSAIGVASFFGLEAVVRILIKRGDDVNVRDGYGLTPLHQSDNPFVTKMLLENGAIHSAEDGYGRTPLHQAAWQGAVNVIEVLLDWSHDRGDLLAMKNEMGNTPLHEATQNEKLASVSFLLEQKSDVDARNIYGITPLHLASRQGNENLVKLLLNHGATINATTDYGESALSMAALRGHENVIRLLLDRESSQGLHPSGQDDIVVKNLLGVQMVNDVDMQGRTVLHLVCAGGTLRYIEELLRRGADPKALDKQERNCLHHAATAGSSKAMKCFLDLGLDPNSIDRDGWTPLHWAARGGKIRNIHSLLEAGADPTMKTESGWTPLGVAQYHGLKGAVGALEAAHRSYSSRTSLSNPTQPSKPNSTPVPSNPRLSPSPEPPVLRNHASSEDLPMLLSNVQPSIGRAFIHRGIVCDGCDLDVYDPRYKCLECADFDYCYKCIKSAALTHPDHRFQSINLAKNIIGVDIEPVTGRVTRSLSTRGEPAPRPAEITSERTQSLHVVHDAFVSLQVRQESQDGQIGSSPSERNQQRETLRGASSEGSAKIIEPIRPLQGPPTGSRIAQRDTEAQQGTLSERLSYAPDIPTFQAAADVTNAEPNGNGELKSSQSTGNVGTTDANPADQVSDKSRTNLGEYAFAIGLDAQAHLLHPLTGGASGTRISGEPSPPRTPQNSAEQADPADSDEQRVKTRPGEEAELRSSTDNIERQIQGISGYGHTPSNVARRRGRGKGDLDCWNTEAAANSGEHGWTDKELPLRPVTVNEETSGQKEDEPKSVENPSVGERHKHSSEDHRGLNSSPLYGPYAHSIPRRNSLQDLKLYAVDYTQLENSHNLKQFFNTLSTSETTRYIDRSSNNSVSYYETGCPDLADYVAKFSTEDRRHIRDFQSWQAAVYTTVGNDEKRKRDQALLGNSPEAERNGMEVRFGLKDEKGGVQRMSWVSPW